MQDRVDGIGPTGAGVKLLEDRAEADVVSAPTQRTRSMSGSERRHLVEEEELGELPRLEQWSAPPVLELESAGDPTASAPPSPDHTVGAVEAAAVPVHPTPFGCRDELAEWGDAILKRHY